MRSLVQFVRSLYLLQNDDQHRTELYVRIRKVREVPIFTQLKIDEMIDKEIKFLLLNEGIICFVVCFVCFIIVDPLSLWASLASAS